MLWSFNHCEQLLCQRCGHNSGSTGFILHQFLAGLALYDLALFLAGLRNATDDGSIFLHCFTCSKWNHMLHRTASLLSVIGSTCTVKPRAKRKLSRPTAPSPHLPFPSPLGLGVPHFGAGQVAGHIAQVQSVYRTSWPGRCMSNSVQWDDCIVCRMNLLRLWRWNLSGSGESAEGRRPWHWVWHAMRTQAALYCSFATVCTVWLREVVNAGQSYHPLLRHRFFHQSQDCIKQECDIYLPYRSRSLNVFITAEWEEWFSDI